MLKKTKYKLFEILYGDNLEYELPDKLIYKIDDYFISGLILLNVIAIMLQSFQSINDSLKDFFYYFELTSVIIFSAEYLLRLWISNMIFSELSPIKARIKYIFSFMGLIDLLAILPFYLPFIIKVDLRFLRMLRLMRLFRIFKLAHYSDSVRMVARVINEKKNEIGITLFGAFILLLITSTLMYEIEHTSQPEQFPNIFASLWWAVATLTTIGYGDVYPVTALGKFLAGLTAIFGIGLVAIPTGLISVGFIEEIENKKKSKQLGNDNKDESKCDCPNYCPNCGHKLKKD